MVWFDSNHDYVNEFVETWNAQIKGAKVAMAVLGVLFVVAGVFSALAPMSMYATIQLVAAVLLIVHGVGQIASYLRTPEFFRSGTVLVAGILNALLGVLLFMLPPTAAAGTIVYLIAFMLILTGVERITFARQMSFYQLPGHSAGTVTGVLNIILGVLILLSTGLTAIVVAFIISGYLIMAGVTLIVEAISLKRIPR